MKKITWLWRNTVLYLLKWLAMHFFSYRLNIPKLDITHTRQSKEREHVFQQNPLLRYKDCPTICTLSGCSTSQIVKNKRKKKKKRYNKVFALWIMRFHLQLRVWRRVQQDPLRHILILPQLQNLRTMTDNHTYCTPNTAIYSCKLCLYALYKYVWACVYQCKDTPMSFSYYTHIYCHTHQYREANFLFVPCFTEDTGREGSYR